MRTDEILRNVENNSQAKILFSAPLKCISCDFRVFGIFVFDVDHPCNPSLFLFRARIRWEFESKSVRSGRVGIVRYQLEALHVFRDANVQHQIDMIADLDFTLKFGSNQVFSTNIGISMRITRSRPEAPNRSQANNNR